MKGSLQFKPATADILGQFFDSEDGVLWDECAGLQSWLIIDKDMTC
jgi:hypothetical protein